MSYQIFIFFSRIKNWKTYNLIIFGFNMIPSLQITLTVHVHSEHWNTSCHSITGSAERPHLEAGRVPGEVRADSEDELVLDSVVTNSQNRPNTEYIRFLRNVWIPNTEYIHFLKIVQIIRDNTGPGWGLRSQHRRCTSPLQTQKISGGSGKFKSWL